MSDDEESRTFSQELVEGIEHMGYDPQMMLQEHAQLGSLDESPDHPELMGNPEFADQVTSQINSFGAGPSSAGAIRSHAASPIVGAPAAWPTGGSSAAPGMAQGVAGISNMLKSCFDSEVISRNGIPKKAKLIVRGNDGGRLVEIEFQVDGDGISCQLIFRHNKVGSIRSLTLDSSQEIHAVYYGNLPTAIELKIYGRQDPNAPFYVRKPHVLIETLNPNAFTNGKFIRSLVNQIETTYEQIFERQMYTEVDFDYSVTRESYWLKKGTGKTYFEGVWGLEYNYLLDMRPLQRARLLQISEDADQMPAQVAFAFEGYDPIQGTQHNQLIDEDPESVHVFHPRFVAMMEQYKAEKLQAGLNSSVTVRHCINEFVPRLSALPEYSIDPYWHQIFSQNTFMYFFRGHSHFDRIAKQVLSGYDSLCYKLRGPPYDPQPHQLQTFFHLQQPEAPFGEQIVGTIKISNFLISFLTLSFFILSFYIIFIKKTFQWCRKNDGTTLLDMNTYTEL